MKKVLFILMAVLVTAQVSATVLLVKEYGVNGTYSTIQSAINATVDGDTVMVFPKPSGISWSESTLSISTDITLTDSNHDYFSLNSGNIQLMVANGRTFNIIDYQLSNYTLSTTGSATDANRCVINVIDCNFSTVDLNENGIDSRVMNNIMSLLQFRYGTVVANDVDRIIVYNEYNTGMTDSILIVGNYRCDIEISTYYYVWIYNNYCYEYSSSTSSAENVLRITNMNSGSDNYNIIANNTFDYHYYGVEMRYHSNTKIVNNYFKVMNSSDSYPYALRSYSGSNGTPFVSYNRANNNDPQRNVNNIPVGLEYNCFGSCYNDYSIDSYGRVTNANTGSYLGEYNDIDLTRNNVGTYGGPHSIDNFWGQANPNGSKARINFLNLPHFLTTPGTINVKGGAHIRN